MAQKSPDIACEEDDLSDDNACCELMMEKEPEDKDDDNACEVDDSSDDDACCEVMIDNQTNDDDTLKLKEKLKRLSSDSGNVDTSSSLNDLNKYDTDESVNLTQSIINE